LEAWGPEYNQLGEVCDSSKQSKREEINIGNYSSFTHSVVVDEQGSREEKESLELEQPWRENSRAS
jgi:hypothetical protein